MQAGNEPKLAECWEGLFTLTKKNSPLSYGVHIQLLKKYNRDSEQTRVCRVTSVFEADTTHDDIVTRYSEADIVEQQLQDSQTKDIDDLLKDYSDVMTS